MPASRITLEEGRARWPGVELARRDCGIVLRAGLYDAPGACHAEAAGKEPIDT